MLAKLAYAPTLTESLCLGGGAISHLENYDPLSCENAKRPKGNQGKTPEKLLIGRGA